MAEVVKAAFNKTKTAPSLDKVSSHMEGCQEVRGLAASHWRRCSVDPSNSGGTDHFVELFAAALKIGINGSPVPAISAEAGDLVRAFTDLYRHLSCVWISIPRGKNRSLPSSNPICGVLSLISRENRLKRKWKNLKTAPAAGDMPTSSGGCRRPLQIRNHRCFRFSGKGSGRPSSTSFRTPIPGSGTCSDPYSPAQVSPTYWPSSGIRSRCIYGFRGTGLQAYNAARNLVPPDSVYRLDTNYRSTPSLVAAANLLFEPLFTSAADGNPVGFEPVRPGRTVRKPAAAGPGPAVTFLDVKTKNDASEAIVAAVRAAPRTPERNRPTPRTSLFLYGERMKKTTSSAA